MRSWSSIIPTLVAVGASFGCQQQPVLPAPERLFFDSPATWVPPLPALRVSNDQKWAVFGRGRWLELVNLETGRTDDERKRGNLGTVTDLAFPADGSLVRRGTREGQTSRFLEGGEILSGLPPNAVARWSPRGTAVAHYETGSSHTVMVGTIDAPRRFELESNIRALAWSHDGRLIGYTVGLPRAADALLNMDVDVVAVDENARPTSPPRRLIDGYHEDFTPAWSPDGQWLAFHSHRSPTPVPF